MATDQSEKKAVAAHQTPAPPLDSLGFLLYMGDDYATDKVFRAKLSARFEDDDDLNIYRTADGLWKEYHLVALFWRVVFRVDLEVYWAYQSGNREPTFSAPSFDQVLDGIQKRIRRGERGYMSTDSTEKKIKVAATEERHYLALDIEGTGPGPEHKMVALGVVLSTKSRGIVLKTKFTFPLCEFPATPEEVETLLSTTKNAEWNPATLTGFWKPRIEWAHKHLRHPGSGSVANPRREAESEYREEVTRVIHFLQLLLLAYPRIDLISDNPNYDLGRLDQLIFKYGLGPTPLREFGGDHRNVWCVDSMLKAKGEYGTIRFKELKEEDKVEHDHLPENDAHCHWLAFMACV